MIPLIGIDPGVNGAMAMINAEAPQPKLLAIYPFTDQTVDQLVYMMTIWTDFVKAQAPAHRTVYLEKVCQISGDGPQGAFTFGKVYGGLLFGFKALGMTVLSPTPQLWMSRLDCLTGGNKKVTANKAKQIFPGVLDGKLQSYVNAVSDAMLIAEYGRRQLKGIR